MDNNTVYEWILQSTFTVSARAESLHHARPHLAPIVRPGDKVLDLCCGSGFLSFWLEALGARVSGVDFAPYMIAMAKEEAGRRKSSVTFIEADIFELDFGQERYDLVTCFDSISDFDLVDFARLGEKVARLLKHGGRFAIRYVDGYERMFQGNVKRQGMYQEEPERISFYLKEYLPEVGAVVNTIRNETLGEEYERKGYIYTTATVRLALGDDFAVERHIPMEDNQFIDIFIKS